MKCQVFSSENVLFCSAEDVNFLMFRCIYDFLQVITANVWVMAKSSIYCHLNNIVHKMFVSFTFTLLSTQKRYFVYTKKVLWLHKKGISTTQKRYFDYTKKVFWLHKKGILTTQKRYFDYRTKIFWLRHRTECNTILIRHCSSHILVNNIMYSTWRHLCLPWHNLSLK